EGRRRYRALEGNARRLQDPRIREEDVGHRQEGGRRATQLAGDGRLPAVQLEEGSNHEVAEYYCRSAQVGSGLIRSDLVGSGWIRSVGLDQVSRVGSGQSGRIGSAPPLADPCSRCAVGSIGADRV